MNEPRPWQRWVRAKLLRSREHFRTIASRVSGWSPGSRIGRWALAAGSLVLVIPVATCALRPERAVEARVAAPTLQVVLADGQREIVVELDGPFVLEDSSGRVVASGTRLAPGRFRAAGAGISLNGRAIPVDRFRVRPTAGSAFRFGERSYPGALRLDGSGGSLRLTNELDVETYLEGVLFSEMPRSFGAEALKAQAVAARSYAYWKILQGRDTLSPTEADQVYGGRPDPRLEREARQILESTRGQVLEHGGKPFCTYYSSTCGGTTSPVSAVFGERRVAPLGGVRCRWCRDAPLYRWERLLPHAELAAVYNLGRTKLGDVERDLDATGRTLEVRLLGDGLQRSFRGLEFRSLWNAGRSRSEQLPSALFHSLSVVRDGLQVRGGGFGHGVGLCQYGCRGLAREGANYGEILATYYPKSRIVQRW